MSLLAQSTGLIVTLWQPIKMFSYANEKHLLYIVLIRVKITCNEICFSCIDSAVILLKVWRSRAERALFERPIGERHDSNQA